VTLLELDGLTTGYKGVPVVHGVSLHVDPGEVVVILGANGAGKTTSLLTISGLLPAIGGSIRFDGREIQGDKPERIARGGLLHVPEDRSLFKQLTVAENLQMGAASKDDLAGTLDHFPRLKPILGRRAAVLSGGEQQMLALARALAGRPRLLMVDEMSLGLAPLIVEGLFPVLQNVAREAGCAVLLVEQHVHLALEIADRAYVMSRGEVVAEGSAADVRGSLDVLTGSYLGGDGASTPAPAAG
jgi:branched-chain amino acid transport system ATP-binding protein